MNKDSLRFIGRNGSMGLTRGQTYRVSLESRIGGYLARIWDYRTGRSVKCPYSSLGAFTNNWQHPRKEWKR